MQKTAITLLSALALGGLLAGCGNQQSSSSESSSSAVKSSKVAKPAKNQIVGSFKDNKDGAAITLNSDGTGQYVYADSDNPDTNDQLTWKKDGASYTVTLKDSNVSGPLTAKLSGNQLTLSGSGDWNTETFTKAKGKLDLSQFLTDAHKAQKTSGGTSGNNQASQSQGSQNQSNSNQNSQSGNDNSQSGDTKDYTDSQGGHHHIVMANNPGPHDPKGTDYVTDSDGHTHVFEYDGE